MTEAQTRLHDREFADNPRPLERRNRPMTTNSTVPTTIHAKVHANAARKVTRFFNATFDDIISELYQNARRAGATLIEVVINDDEVSVQDNGHGVADPQALLSFGHSEWANAKSEDPAGMGVYSLAQRTTTITSRHRDTGQSWTCRLEPAHFNGERPATVELDETLTEPGTRITFETKSADGYCQDTAKMMARYLPVTVTVNGKKTRQESFLDERENPSYRPHTTGMTLMSTTESDAVRDDNLRDAIVLYDDGLAVKVTGYDWKLRGSDEGPCRVNFHGHILSTSGIAAAVRSIGAHFAAKIDISRTRGISLVLPARKDVVRDDNAADAAIRTELAIFETIAAQPKPVALPYRTWKRGQALPLSTPLPPQPRTVRVWTAIPADDTGNWVPYEEGHEITACEHGVIVKMNVDPAEQAMLHHALQFQDDKPPLYREEPEYNGYDWYDGLDRITRVTARYYENGTRHETDATGTAAAINRHVDMITIVAHLKRADGTTRTIEYPSNLAFTNAVTSYVDLDPSRVGILVTRKNGPEPLDICDRLEHAFFTENINDERSTRIQHNTFMERTTHEVQRLEKGDDHALSSAIERCIKKHFQHRLPKDRTTTITCTPSESIKIAWTPALEDTAPGQASATST